jgi:hypothetical protein
VTELSAGRDLDRLIAEQVMGLAPCEQWTTISLGSGGGPAMTTYGMDCPHVVGTCYPAVPGLVAPGNGPAPYSTNIAVAWQVVEKISAGDFAFRLSGKADRWRAFFGGPLGVGRDGPARDLPGRAPGSRFTTLDAGTPLS